MGLESVNLIYYKANGKFNQLCDCNLLGTHSYKGILQCIAAALLERYDESIENCCTLPGIQIEYSSSNSSRLLQYGEQPWELFAQGMTGIYFYDQDIATPLKKKVKAASALPLDALPEGVEDQELCSDFSNMCLMDENLLYSTYRHHRELEKRSRFQTNLESLMKYVQEREALVEELLGVADILGLQTDTVFLCVCYIDTGLYQCSFEGKKLRLLGICCLFLSTKYDEIINDQPNIDDFCYVVDCTKEEMRCMENLVEDLLNFEFSYPTIKIFLRTLLVVATDDLESSSSKVEFLSSYISELSLLDYRTLRFLPSEVAASALFLAKLILFPEVPPWSSALLNFSEYRPHDLRDCVLALHVLHKNTRTRNEVSSLSKYKDKKFKSVGKLLPCKEIPEKFFQDIEPLADNILVETFRFESAS